MSVIKPEIDNLLDKTENNPFLLCSIASKRACDINNMVRGQHLRVTAIQDFDDITTVVSGKDPVSVAMQEIEEGTPRLRQGGLRRGHQGRQRHLPVGRCMTERLCLVHYHEIGLKGKNRSTFENQLVTNLHRALRDFPVANIARISGYIVVETTDRLATEELAAAIRRVPGVARVSLAYKCGLDEGEYSSAAVRALGEAGDFASFKVHARRSSTTYAVHTLDMNKIVGSVLCEAFPDKKVDVHTPDVTVVVHVVQGSTYVYAASAPGVGGLPVGTAGKVVTLLSSGFDSPVSTWMVGRRGAHLRARALLGPPHDRRHQRVALPGHRRGARPPRARSAASTVVPVRGAAARDLPRRAPEPAHHHVPPRHAPGLRADRPGSRAPRRS